MHVIPTKYSLVLHDIEVVIVLCKVLVRIIDINLALISYIDLIAVKLWIKKTNLYIEFTKKYELNKKVKK